MHSSRPPSRLKSHGAWTLHAGYESSCVPGAYLPSSPPSTLAVTSTTVYVPSPPYGSPVAMSGSYSRRLLFNICALLAYAGSARASVDSKARITLACLLGGVPAASILLILVFCIWIRRRKDAIRRKAIANGIELDDEGWPVHPQQRRINPANTAAASTDAFPVRGSDAASAATAVNSGRRYSTGGTQNGKDGFVVRSYGNPNAEQTLVPSVGADQNASALRPSTAPGAYQ